MSVAILVLAVSVIFAILALGFLFRSLVVSSRAATRNDASIEDVESRIVALASWHVARPEKALFFEVQAHPTYSPPPLNPGATASLPSLHPAAVSSDIVIPFPAVLLSKDRFDIQASFTARLMAQRLSSPAPYMQAANLTKDCSAKQASPAAIERASAQSSNQDLVQAPAVCVLGSGPTLVAVSVKEPIITPTVVSLSAAPAQATPSTPPKPSKTRSSKSANKKSCAVSLRLTEATPEKRKSSRTPTFTVQPEETFETVADPFGVDADSFYCADFWTDVPLVRSRANTSPRAEKENLLEVPRKSGLGKQKQKEVKRNGSGDVTVTSKARRGLKGLDVNVKEHLWARC